MDSKNQSQVCPWCQTEIVWDPELGPEESCPHCLNELGGYRSVKLKLKGIGDDVSLEDDEDDDYADVKGDRDEEDSLDVMDLLDDYDDERPVENNPYAEKVMAVMDSQEEAPDCSNCHELMLLAGVRRIGGPEFTVSAPVPLGKPFLQVPFVMNVYICPSCFKTDEYLSKSDRETMLKAFASDEE